jgi:putative FmdB family regulatory protein
MPIYEYQCEACGHQLEAIQKVSDAPLRDCPACGEPRLRKLISAAGFRLKGTGWYATDFRDSGKKPAAKGTDKAAEKGPEGGKDAKTPDGGGSPAKGKAAGDTG